MRLTRTVWNRYLAKLRSINDTAAEKMLEWLQKQQTPYTEETERAMIEYAYLLTTKYGEASAAMAAEMYDATAALENVLFPAALPAEPASIGEVAKAVMGTAKSGNPEIISGAVGRLVKLAGVDTTMQNALRDGAEWAWIPSGDTCAFCIALASRGWQQASKKAIKNGHAEHVHANCDCTYAVRFSPDTEIEGYDPQQYLDMYYGADLDGDTPTPEHRLNAMRREFYAANREKILAQKRDAYARSKALNSFAAEEADV